MERRRELQNALPIIACVALVIAVYPFARVVRAADRASLLDAVLFALLAFTAFACVRMARRLGIEARGAHTQAVSSSDQAMQAAATAMELQWTPGAPHQHPLAGTVPGFGQLEGARRGLGLRACVVFNPSGEPNFQSEIRITPLEGARFEIDPQDAGVREAIAQFRAQARVFTIDPEAITLVPCTRWLTQWTGESYAVVTEAAVLEALLEALTNLCVVLLPTQRVAL